MESTYLTSKIQLNRTSKKNTIQSCPNQINYFITNPFFNRSAPMERNYRELLKNHKYTDIPKQVRQAPSTQRYTPNWILHEDTDKLDHQIDEQAQRQNG